MTTNNTDFLEMILCGGEQADKEMLLLLHQRLNHQLRQRFEVYHDQLFDDFEDVVDDFFFYLREGKEGDGQQSYQSLRRIEKRESFEPWILNTFRNYLNVRSNKEAKVICTELFTENVTDSDASSSLLTDERMLTVASNLIAYAHQKLSPRDRFIFLRTLLTLLNKRQALPNGSMAILETALAEILEFDEIALTISLNEYIELAKSYSGDKSYMFINGILTEILREMKAKGTLLKALTLK